MNRKLFSFLRKLPRSLPLAVLTLLTAYCLLPTAVSAQSTSATLKGTVEDQKGSVVAGATVSVADPARGLKRIATTNENGSFTVPLLPPSTYTVTVEQKGFAPVQVNDVILNVNDDRALLITLKVGAVGAAVEVTTEAQLINESPAVSTTVDQRFVENLPLNGRSFQSLIALTPGVVRTGTEGQFSVNGQRDNANYFTVDGVSGNVGTSLVNNAATGGLGQSGSGQTPSFNSVGGTSGLVSVDAMQEFRIQTSTYAAEFGRSPGGQIQIVTRSGAKDFHGSVYDYLRNDALDSKNWFNNANNLQKSPLRQNDFGGVVGGPIYFQRFWRGKNRTYFFFSFEGLRLRLPVTIANRLVPSLVLRTTAAASIQPYLNTMPLPTGGDAGNGAAFFSAAFSNPTTINAASLRIDHNFSEKLTIFGRFNVSPSKQSVRSAALPTTVTNSEKNVRTLTFGATWLLRSTKVNELRGNYSKNDGKSTFTNDNFGGAVPISSSLLFP